MKKTFVMLAVIICICIVFSTAAAFQLSQDQLPDVSSFFNKDDSGSSRSVQSLTLNSVEIYGEADQNTQAVLDMLSGAKLEYSSQLGDSPRYSLDLSLPDTPILTYSLQRGTPYYVGSNFFGENIYMIYPEDEFEEKLVTAFYHLLEKVSDDTSNLPDLDQLLATIKAIKEGNVKVMPVESMQSLSLTQEINPSAFMELLGDLMTRFAVAEPTANISYRYTEFDPANFAFEWPSEALLPEISAAESAMTGTFYGEDIIKFLDCLPQFLEDNPELSDMLNQVIVEVMNQTNPEMGIPEGTDILKEVVGGLGQSAQGLQGFYLNLKIDNDKYGSPVMIAIKIGQSSGDSDQGIILTIIPAFGYPTSAVDIALDMFAGVTSMPMFRALYFTDSENASSGLNFLAAPSYSFKLEYAQHTSKTENVFGSENTDTIIDYLYTSAQGYSTDTSSDISGHASILTTAEPNAFDGEDQSTQISYTQQMAGTPIFSLSITSDNKTVEGLPILTSADAISASGMSEEDYDDLAGTIFLQLMQLMMNFM